MGLLIPDETSASLEHNPNPGVEQHRAGQGPATRRVHASAIFSIASDPSCQSWRTALSDLQMAVASAVGGWSAMQDRSELLRVLLEVKAACCQPPYTRWDLRNSMTLER
jgi:hypothetical protein